MNKDSLLIDADSIIYKAIYRKKEEDTIEDVYASFCAIVSDINRAYYNFSRYLDEIKVENMNYFIFFSTKKSWRNDYYSNYKSKRKLRNPMVAEIKKMALTRLRDKIIVKANTEADDLVIYYQSIYGCRIAAMDKDVLNASINKCYNYNQYGWRSGKDKWEIEKWYAKQALMGDSTDGIPGASGIGEVKADKFIDKTKDYLNWNKFVKLFDGDEEEALTMMNLVRMDLLTIKKGKVKVNHWYPEDSEYWQ